MKSNCDFGNDRDLSSGEQSSTKLGFSNKCPATAEEPFPDDTVKQIYQDIENLFSDCDDSSSSNTNMRIVAKKKQRPKSVPIVDDQQTAKRYRSKFASNRINFLLNDLLENDLSGDRFGSHNDCIQLCFSQLCALESMLDRRTTTTTTTTTTNNNNNNNTNSSLMIGSHSGYRSDSMLELADLHAFVWKLFTVHDMLLRECASDDNFNNHSNNNNITNANPEVKCGKIKGKKLHYKLIRTIERWYAVAVLIKDSLIRANNVTELRVLLASIDRNSITTFRRLWSLTRSLQTLLWIVRFHRRHEKCSESQFQKSA